MRKYDLGNQSERGSSKGLSARVSTAAGLQPHPITRNVWRVSAYAALTTAVLVGAYLLAGGDTRAFQTDRVAPPHATFEHRCEACHTTWGPARRIAATFTGGTVHSVTNEKCEACHRGALHHSNQLPGHEPDDNGEFLSCAKCHREHRGNIELSWTASGHCTDCHANLGSHTRPGRPAPYAPAIRDFELDGGHPEFALIRVLEGESIEERGETVVTRAPPPEEIAPIVLPPGDPPPDRAWHDPARIRFNHFAHLRRPLPVRADEANAVRWGARMKCYEIGEDSAREIPCDEETAPMVELACNDCHRTDANGRYMLAIDYTEHCRICHSIPFDTERFPGLTVPHAAIAEASRERAAAGMEVLRGFLAEKYAANIARDPAREAADALLQLPGRPTRSLLTAAERSRVRREADDANEKLMRELTDADLVLLRSTLNTIGESARGGCRFCHQVKATPIALAEALPGYRIEPTRIPDRWMPHSRFDHASHREMKCGACHLDNEAPEGFRGVEFSAHTSDVLMPTIGVCRECHSRHPTRPDVGSARSDCVECHTYHDHARDPFDTGPRASREPMHEGAVP